MDPYPISVLSPHEQRVASLLVAGLTTAEITERLGITWEAAISITERITPRLGPTCVGQKFG